MFEKYGSLRDISTAMSVIGGILFIVSIGIGGIILINASNAGSHFILVLAGAAFIEDLLLMAFSLLVMGVGGAIKVVVDIAANTDTSKLHERRAA